MLCAYDSESVIFVLGFDVCRFQTRIVPCCPFRTASQLEEHGLVFRFFEVKEREIFKGVLRGSIRIDLL